MIITRTLVVSVLLALAASGTFGAITPVLIIPNRFVVNTTTTVSKMHVYPSIRDAQLYFLKRPEAGLTSQWNCTAPPPDGSTNIRTSILRVKNYTVTFPSGQLDSGTYVVCYRNATTGSGYSNFRPLTQTVAIVTFSFCRKGKLGICKVLPAAINARDGNVTVKLYYARQSTQAFIMKRDNNGWKQYNCTRPPPIQSRMRSPTATVGAQSSVVFNVEGLIAGTYLICFKNNTKQVFQPLTQVVVVSGSIDAKRSTVSCCFGPFLVGERTYCQISTRDSNNNPAGGSRDACDLRVCPITDGAGRSVTNFVQPYYLGVGLYEFYFVAEGSGCGASVGANYKGLTLMQNKVNYFSLYPGPAVYTKSTADCSYNKGLVSCNVTKRDRFGNPVSKCSVSSKGTYYCQTAQGFLRPV